MIDEEAEALWEDGKLMSKIAKKYNIKLVKNEIKL